MQRGYVLHSRPFSESRLLVNLLVDGQGRVDAVARVGSGKRSIKGLLQPFQPLLFQLVGRSNLKTLTQLENAAPAIPLKGNSLYASMYLNELLIRMLTGTNNAEQLFISYHQTLIELVKEFNQASLRYFELNLLEQLGYLPSFTHDAQGQPIETQCYYRFYPEQGFIIQKQGISGSVLFALANQKLTEADWQSAKLLTRQILQPLIGNKPLISRQLFANQLRK